MNCDRFEERVQQLLDRREDPRDDFELVEHAGDCAGCGRSFASAVSLVEFFIDCPVHTELPVGFIDGVMDRARRSMEVEIADVIDAEIVTPDAASNSPRPAVWAAALEHSNEAGRRDVAMETVPARWGAAAPQTESTVGAARSGGGDWLVWSGFVAAMALALLVSAVVFLTPPSDSTSLAMTDPANDVAPIGGANELMSQDRSATRITPVLATIGDESLEVVRPIADGFSVAYTLLRWHLLGGSSGIPADIRFDSVRDYWS